MCVWVCVWGGVSGCGRGRVRVSRVDLVKVQEIKGRKGNSLIPRLPYIVMRNFSSTHTCTCIRKGSFSTGEMSLLASRAEYYHNSGPPKREDLL